MNIMQQLLATCKQPPWQSAVVVQLLEQLKQQRQILTPKNCMQILSSLALNQDRQAFHSLQQHPHFSINAVDPEGRTAAHTIAELAYDNEQSIAALQFLERFQLDYQIRDQQGQTAADIAIVKQKKQLATTCLSFELRESHFSKALSEFLNTRENKQRAIAIVQATQAQVLTEIRRLSRVIKLPSSEIDEAVESALDKLGIAFTSEIDGYELPLPQDTPASLSSTQARALYALTPIGKLEAFLTDSVAQHLHEFALDQDEGILAQWEAEHNETAEAIWQQYHEIMAEFEEADLGYDYEGAIRPPTPTIGPFNRRRAESELRRLFPRESKPDIDNLLEHISIEPGLLGDMLYQAFIGMEIIDDIVAEIDFTAIGLEKALSASILRAIDWQFPDIDITKPGYLIDIFESNLTEYFHQSYMENSCEAIEKLLYQHLASQPQAIATIRQFNQVDNDLGRQRCWAALSEVVQLAVTYYQQQDSKRQQQIAAAIDKAKDQLPAATELVSMYKVFPTDQSEDLVYTDEHGDLHSAYVSCSLKPIMKTLYTIAAGTHDLLVKQANPQARKTNIATAMLSFVVGVSDPQTGHQRNDFYHVPLTLDYSSLLLSKDHQNGVFVDENDFETSVGLDRHHASLVIETGTNPITPSRATEAKQTITRLLSTLHLSSAQSQEISSLLANAEIAQPMALDFYLQEGIQKSSPFYHSERVILHALKKPANVTKILNQLLQQVSQAYPSANLARDYVIRVQSANLLLYSHPNSVCGECSTGIIAAQQPATSEFLKQLENAFNRPDCPFQGPLDATGQRRLLQLNAIVASSHIFANDASGQLIKKRPAAKLPYTQANVQTQSQGIFVGPKAKAANYFYEFTESQIAQSNTHTPLVYEGIIAMSGSKARKCGSSAIDRQVENLVKQHNQAVASTAQCNSQHYP